MYPLTLTQPKALLPLGRKPIINYIIDQINTLPDVNEIIVVANNKFYSQFELWSKRVDSDCPVNVLNDGTTNEDNRLGAIGDINFTLRVKNIDEDIVVIAGDNYMTYPLMEQYQLFKEKQSDVVCGQRLDDRKLLTRLAVATLDENNKIISLVEKPEDPQSDVAIFATYFYQKETLPLFAQYLQAGETPDAPGYFVQWLYNKKDVYTYIMNGECYDIGTIEAYENMQKDMEMGDLMNIKESDEFIAITGVFSDDSGKMNYQLLNKQFIQFASGSKTVSEMLGNRASTDEILMFIIKNRASHLASKKEFLSDEEAKTLISALEELDPRGAFKELKLHLRKMAAR